MMGGGIFMILVFGVLIFLAVSFFKKNGFEQTESAEDKLRRRYAGGEISKEDFEQMKRDITA